MERQVLDHAVSPVFTSTVITLPRTPLISWCTLLWIPHLLHSQPSDKHKGQQSFEDSLSWEVQQVPPIPHCSGAERGCFAI